MKVIISFRLKETLGQAHSLNSGLDFPLKQQLTCE